jgi:uncharacterized membrane protein YozB (DUF420 family)
MTVEAGAGRAHTARLPFAPYHKADRNFFLIYVALIWLGILMGFGGDIADHIRRHAPPFPLIIHFHALAFGGWLVVLTTQVLLIRRGRHDLHRKLGIAAIALYAVMLVLGPATAIVANRSELGTPDADPAFLAIQLTDIIAFAGLAGAAILLRRNPPAHKRLILIATLYIAAAGFARWLGSDIHAVLGSGYWQQIATLELPTDLLMLGVGAYDLATRGRLHPVFLPAVIYAFAIQMVAAYLYLDPAWKPVALSLLTR